MDQHNLAQNEHYNPSVWRVIIHREADGPFNMAADQAIAEAVGNGDVPPTLRLYGWSPACLSLGYTQPVTDVDRVRLGERGWLVVRRLTGGRAILHVDELTYSVCAPETDPRMSGGIVESYRRLSRGLMSGLQLLGTEVDADAAAEDAHRFKGAVCFEVPSDYEITAFGRKLLGSAQARRSGQAVLQHGTLPLYGDVARICDALVFSSDAGRQEARLRVAQRAITLEEALGKAVSYDEAVSAMMRGFSESLNLELVQGELSDGERQRAAELVQSVYAADEWTVRH